MPVSSSSQPPKGEHCSTIDDSGRVDYQNDQLLSDNQIYALWRTSDERFCFRIAGKTYALFEDGDLHSFRSEYRKRTRRATSESTRSPANSDPGTRVLGLANKRLFALLGELLGSKKEPSRWATRDEEGEWRTPFGNVVKVAEEFKKRLLTEDNPYTLRDKKYVPLHVFLEVAGYRPDEGGICDTYEDRIGRPGRRDKRGKPHPALERTIDLIPINLLEPGEDLPKFYIRRNGHNPVRLHALKDAYSIREYRETATRGGSKNRRRYRVRPIVNFLRQVVRRNGPVTFKQLIELGKQSTPKFSKYQIQENRERAGLLTKKLGQLVPVVNVWYFPDQDPLQFNRDPILLEDFAAPSAPRLRASGEEPTTERNQFSQLNETHQQILDALFDLKAFSAAYLFSANELTLRIEGKATGTVGKAAAELKRKFGLVDSKTGRGNGYWLTPNGKNYIEQIRAIK